MLLQESKFIPIGLVSRYPPSTSSTRERSCSSSYYSPTHGWGCGCRNGRSANDASTHDGYDARENGCSGLYARSDGSGTCFVRWTNDRWTWSQWARWTMGTTAPDVSGAYAASTPSTSSPATFPTTAATSTSTTTRINAFSRACSTVPFETTFVG